MNQSPSLLPITMNLDENYRILSPPVYSKYQGLLSKCSSRHWIAHSVHEVNTCLCTVAGSGLQGLRADSSPHIPARHHGRPKQLCSYSSDGAGAGDPPRSHTSRTHPQTCHYSRLCGVSITFFSHIFQRYVGGSEGSSLICLLHVHIWHAN